MGTPGRAIAGYASAFNDRFGTAPGVASPLGAWLLLAVAAPLSTDADRERVERLLGMPVAAAAECAGALLADPHPAVAAAVAAWADPSRLLPAHDGWTTPSAVDRGPLPDQQQLDAWAARHTDGLIERFPIRIDPATLLVLGSALATRISWAVPLTEVDGALRLEDGRGRQAVVHTAAAGPVGVAIPDSGSGLEVLSVIAAPEVPPGDVHRAAHELLADRTPTRVTADGHAWTVTERVERRYSHRAEIERWTSTLPVWTATSEHDLGDAPGVPELFRAFEQRFFPPQARPLVGEARQTAVAAYTREGFEAAAVTGIGLRAGSAPPPEREVVVRDIALRFDRPHAVLAALNPHVGGPWAGVPVFSAWVSGTG